MPEKWVINASPVILLAKAEVIHFLPKLCDELVIPSGVVAEVHNIHITDAGRKWLEEDGLQYVRQSPPIHAAMAKWRGGLGEAEVISWALQYPGFIAVLDDRRARLLAKKNNVPLIGSLRVIVMAKERGLIPAAKPALERLRGVGAYLTDELIDRSIAFAGE